MSPSKQRLAAPPTAAPPVLKPDQVTAVQVVPGTPFQQVIQVAVPERQRTNPIGVAALVLGIIAALIAWVPFLGLVAIPVAILGALLGAIGLIYGLISRRGKVVTSTIGLALCLGSVLLSVVMTGSVANQIGVAMKKAQQKKNRSAQPAIAAAPVVPDAKTRTIEGSPASSPAPAIAVQPAVVPAPVIETWLSPDQPGQLGNVQVRRSSVTLGQVVLRDQTPFPGREKARGESKDPLLSIVLEISNLDPNRKLEYKTFAGQSLVLERDNAALRDNFGNRYRGIDFGFSSLPEFRTEDESIYPGKMIKDHLVFEAPIATAAHLDLEIPAVNVGQTGFFRFRIPAHAIQRTQSRLVGAREKELAVVKTKAGFPSIAGVWQEGPTRLTITQNDDKFTATRYIPGQGTRRDHLANDRYHIKRREHNLLWYI